MKILVPMAGGLAALHGDSGMPAGLVEVAEEPILQHVVRNLEVVRPGEFIFVVHRATADRFHLDAMLRLLAPNSSIIFAGAETAGAACTALLAVDAIDPSAPLIIANGDQILAADLQAEVQYFMSSGCDAGVLVFKAIHPRWSYVRLNDRSEVVEAAEKRPISDHATAGFYFFRRGADFIAGAQEMIRKDAHVNGMFYVCPVFNELILLQKRIVARPIPRNRYFKLSTPAGVKSYERFLAEKTRR